MKRGRECRRKRASWAASGRVTLCLALIAVAAGHGAAVAKAAEAAPDVVLTGELTGTDHQTYRELPFALPAGVRRLQVTFTYDRANGTVVDLGLRDPERLRGWSGGNKASFFVGVHEATPSYLPGPLPEGTWHLVLGIPNHRADARTSYRAEIEFDPAPAPLVAEARWYRGDFHAHSGHSDGSCPAQSGATAPCPVYRTVEAAAARGLDFVALSEHNTVSHRQALAELQAAFDRLLLLPAMELTTFHGHANVLGAVDLVDFRAATQDPAGAFARIRDAGGLVSINHPGLPSDERCLGCGWTADVDPALVEAVEVLNGGAIRAAGAGADGALSGIPYWERLLEAGHRVSAIAGSDNHDALFTDAPSAVGRPTTVVHAVSLSEPNILDGVRSGRVFIDVEGTSNRLIDLEVEAGAARAGMGGVLPAPVGRRMDVTVRVRNAPGSRIVLIGGGVETTIGTASASSDETMLAHAVRSDGKTRWLRAEARDAAGALLLVSNAVYLEPTARNTR